MSNTSTYIINSFPDKTFSVSPQNQSIETQQILMYEQHSTIDKSTTTQGAGVFTTIGTPTQAQDFFPLLNGTETNKTDLPNGVPGFNLPVENMYHNHATNSLVFKYINCNNGDPTYYPNNNNTPLYTPNQQSQQGLFSRQLPIEGQVTNYLKLFNSPKMVNQGLTYPISSDLPLSDGKGSNGYINFIGYNQETDLKHVTTENSVGMMDITLMNSQNSGNYYSSELSGSLTSLDSFSSSSYINGDSTSVSFPEIGLKQEFPLSKSHNINNLQLLSYEQQSIDMQGYPQITKNPEVMPYMNAENSQVHNEQPQNKFFNKAQTTMKRQLNERSRSMDIPKAYPCQICPKVFQKPFNLKSHMVMHSNLKPYKCKLCKRAFARNHDKKRHELSHHKVEGLFCGYNLKDILKYSATVDEKDLDLWNQGQAEVTWGCAKQFARVDGLVRHLQSDLGFICVLPLLKKVQESKAMNVNGKEYTAVWKVYQNLKAALGEQVIDSLMKRTNEFLKKIQDQSTDINQKSQEQTSKSPK